MTKRKCNLIKKDQKKKNQYLQNVENPDCTHKRRNLLVTYKRKTISGKTKRKALRNKS